MDCADSSICLILRTNGYLILVVALSMISPML